LLATGGTAVAAHLITSADVEDETLCSIDIKNDTLRSKDVQNATLRSTDVRDETLRLSDLRADTITELQGKRGPEAGQVRRVQPVRREMLGRKERRPPRGDWPCRS